MSFTSLNGKLDVTLPADTKARLRVKTNNGSVYTDFDVKLQSDASKPVIEDAHGQGGKYRIRMDRGVYGSINGGGPEYCFSDHEWQHSDPQKESTAGSSPVELNLSAATADQVPEMNRRTILASYLCL